MLRSVNSICPLVSLLWKFVPQGPSDEHVPLHWTLTQLLSPRDMHGSRIHLNISFLLLAWLLLDCRGHIRWVQSQAMTSAIRVASTWLCSYIGVHALCRGSAGDAFGPDTAGFSLLTTAEVLLPGGSSWSVTHSRYLETGLGHGR